MSKIVTFEQAKMLKELGFDGECLYWYNEDGVKECPIEQGYMEYYYDVDCFLNDWNAKKIDRDLYGSYPPKESYSAPTVSEALDWVREEKGIMCGVSLDSEWRQYKWWHELEKDRIVSHVYYETSINGYDEYPECEDKLLDSVLTYLEQKEKQ